MVLPSIYLPICADAITSHGSIVVLVGQECPTIERGAHVLHAGRGAGAIVVAKVEQATAHERAHAASGTGHLHGARLAVGHVERGAGRPISPFPWPCRSLGLE